MAFGAVAIRGFSKRSIASGVSVALLLAFYLLASETLYLVHRSAYFLSDLGGALVHVIAWYAAGAIAAGVLVGMIAQRGRQAFVLALVGYLVTSLKILLVDAQLLADATIVSAFAAMTVVGFAGLALVQKRLALPELTPILLVVAYANACLGIASGWALAGGRLLEFLLTPRTLLFALGAVAGACVAIVIERRLARRADMWRGALHCALLAGISLGIALESRSIPTVPDTASSHGDERDRKPDIVVLSFDALRADILSEYVAAHPHGHLATLVAHGTSYPNVFAEGLSTDDILASNTFGGSRRDTCDGSLPRLMSDRGFFTAMLFAGVGRRFEGSVCYQYYFAGSGRDMVPRYAVPAVARAVTTRQPRVRAKNLRADALLERIESLAATRLPIFAYTHFLELHAPYVPAKRRDDRAYRTALEEFLSRCYVVACDPRVPANAALIATVRGGYVELLDEVDAVVGRVVDVLQRRANRPFVIILTADHGELFGEHGGFAHGGGFVPELLTIPFVVYDSRQQSPRRSCELMPSSEALRLVVTGALGADVSLPARSSYELAVPPLGAATIDATTATLRYEIAPSLRGQAGTWRNIHREVRGVVEFPIATCP
jgi:hypothetical protein